jgi:hypothetical protein
MSLREDTLRAAVLKALAEEVATAVDSGKDHLKQVMDDNEIDSLSALLPDGTKVGKVYRGGGNSLPVITDPEKFLAWVQEHRPGEVVPSVRESYQKALLEAIKKAGAPVDPETGEAVPGVEFKESKAFVAVAYADKQESPELIKEAWRSGRISLPAILALPAAGGESGD